MKKTLLTLALVGLSAVASFAQGTISFGNSVLNRLQYQEVLGGPINTALPVGTHVGAFWGTDAGGAVAITGIDRMGTAAGATALSGAGGLFPATGVVPVYPVAGSQEGQRVWIKIAAWVGGDNLSPKSAGVTHYGESTVVSALLGPTAGPGTVIWQGAAGTATDRAKPFVVAPIPEPSVIALGALGLGALLLRRRKA
jgi:hypothetical protein